MVKWFTSISRFMLAFTQLQALTGPEGSSQCLSGLLAFIVARSVTLQNHLTIFITQLQALYRPGGPMQCLSGFLVFTTTRNITKLQALHGTGGPLQCLWSLLAVTIARFITSSELVNLTSSYSFLRFMIKFLKNLYFMFYPMNRISSENASNFISQLKILQCQSTITFA